MSVDAGSHGEHGRTILVAGDATIGELRWFRAVPSCRLCFCLTAMQAQLTCGPRLTVTVYSKASSFIPDLIAVL